METRPDAVEHPWDMMAQMPDKEPKLVAPGTTMLELFDQANGSLLILGSSPCSPTPGDYLKTWTDAIVILAAL